MIIFFFLNKDLVANSEAQLESDRKNFDAKRKELNKELGEANDKLQKLRAEQSNNQQSEKKSYELSKKQNEKEINELKEKVETLEMDLKNSESSVKEFFFFSFLIIIFYLYANI